MGSENTLFKEVLEDAQLTIERVDGDLVLEGTSDERLIITGEEVELTENEKGRRFTLSAGGDCRVRVPQMVHVAIDSVNGDARVSSLDFPLTIDHVDGDLVLRGLNNALSIDTVGSAARIVDVNGPVSIDSVGADCVIRDVNGPVSIDSVGADLEVKRVNGPFSCDSVGSDVEVKEISGPVSVASVGSDAVVTEVQGPVSIGSVGSDLVLNTPFDIGTPYNIGSVGSDVVVKVRQGSNVQFVVPEGTERSINVRGVRVESDGENDTIIIGENEMGGTVHIGSIGSELQLVSAGKSFSAEFEFNFPENFGEMISTRISEQLSRIQENLERQVERIQQQAERERQRVEREAQRIEQQAERERQRAEREGQRSRARGARGSKSWTWNWGEGRMTPPMMPPVPPVPPVPPRAFVPPRPSVQPVTEQERLAILRMVENKQITIEEAERLLAALEGRG